MGDIHGHLGDLLRAFNICGWPSRGTPYIMFAHRSDQSDPSINRRLGDYVDRGRHGLECMLLLLALKVIHPQQVIRFDLII